MEGRSILGWKCAAAGLALAAGLAAGDAAGATHALDYTAKGGVSAEFDLKLGQTEVRFRKEPQYAGEKVARGALYVSPDRKDYVGFAFDETGEKLYLDMNRNLDLTDDPDGIRSKKSDGWRADFPGVEIAVEKEGRRREMVVDFQFYGTRRGWYEVQSSWGAEGVEIGGKRFRISVVDNGDGRIGTGDILKYALEGGGKNRKHGAEMAAPETLAVDGAQHALSYEIGADGRTLALKVEPLAGAAMAVARIEGESIDQIHLQDGATAALLFEPAKEVRVPPGDYRAQVWVRMGEGENQSTWVARNVRLKAAARGETVWQVGGPVRSKLSCRSTANVLRFDQESVGAGGAKYTIEHGSGKSAGNPKLRVKKAGKVVHVGQFEYG